MIFVLPTGFLVAWLLRVRDTPREQLAKPLASLSFVLVALSEGALDDRYGQLILAGLVLGAIGDVALMYDRGFLAGLVAFALGHVAYIVAFIGFGPPSPAAIVVGVVVAVASLGWLLPHLDGVMRLAVPAYVAIIAVMLMLGIDPDRPGVVRAGAVMFALSDLLVARQRFVTPDPRNGLWGLPTYYTAQVLIALSVVA